MARLEVFSSAPRAWGERVSRAQCSMSSAYTVFSVSTHSGCAAHDALQNRDRINRWRFLVRVLPYCGKLDCKSANWSLTAKLPLLRLDRLLAEPCIPRRICLVFPTISHRLYTALVASRLDSSMEPRHGILDRD